MTFASVLKILVLIATLATAAAGVLQAISPEIAVVVGAVASAIFAFTKAIGGDAPVDPVE